MFQIPHTPFYEKINLTKLKHIVANPQKYKDIIDEQERDMRRHDKHYNAFATFQKIINNCIITKELEGTEYAFIKVSYKKGTTSNNIGRWYANKSIGLQSLVCCVRHTICDDIWVDIDQVNSHPTIFKTFMNKYGFNSDVLDECLNNREAFLKRIGGNRDKAKTQVIAVINGGLYPNNKVLHQLSLEIKPCIDHVINLPEYKEVYDYVKQNYDKNIEGKTISRILQIIENDLLECYVEWSNNKGFIEDGSYHQISLIFDGFQLLKKNDITDELLEECRKNAYDKTGYDIQLKIKPFDNPLKLPDDYAEFADIIPSLVDKFMVGIELFVENNEGSIALCLVNKGSNLSIATLASKLFKKWTYYDSKREKWYYCDLNNVWCETKKPIILKYLIQRLLQTIFLIYTNKLNKELYTDGIDVGKKSILEEKVKTVFKIIQSLQSMSFMDSIMKCEVLYLKEGFYEDYIDSKPYLFAFKNKVYNFKNNELRYIKPDDYIMTNTGYDYPEYVDDENTDFINKYFNTLFPNVEMKNYVLDSCCSTLNGEKHEQYFNIHTGSGSNSKTTFSGLYESALGNYGCEVSPETFTKPKKSANDTGELYKAKGKRCIFTNEPEADTDKLQTAILKRIADEGGRKIIARQLYGDPVEFPITFQLNMFCNNKPELSSVDGGIARRLRVVDWKMKFVDNPDPNNIYQAPKDAELMTKIRTDDVRNAFIRLLLDRWCNRVSAFKLIPVPKEIKEASADFVDDSNPVLGFIMNNYELTNDVKDEINTTTLYNHFVSCCRDSKISTKRFKDDMLGISGVLTNRHKTKGVLFLGLKLIIKPDKDDDKDDEN
jgi:P4 family phage/plasmid primase-like protien